ncbi:MAG: hypothetical protein KC656_01025 [Myxococcales bacterium]|nr:hypothetical protein [Myxococcales bacterium]
MHRALLALGLLLAATPASALTCYRGPYAVNVDDTRLVPTNVRFFFEVRLMGPDEEIKIELTGPRGVKIPVEIVERSPTHAVAVPTYELAPRTVYRIKDQVEGLVDVTFRTGDGPDRSTPERPRLQSLEREHSESRFGLIDRLLAVVEPASDASHWELELADDFSFVHPLVARSADPAISAGQERCSATVEGYDRTRSYYVRVRAVDAAGNRSEWNILPKSDPPPARRY